MSNQPQSGNQPPEHGPVQEASGLLSNLDLLRPQSGEGRQLTAESAEELLQRRRLESILDAIENVELVDGVAAEKEVKGKINTDARDVATLTAVQRAIRQCYGLLMRHLKQLEDDETSLYWHGMADAPLGFVEFDNVDVRYGFYGLQQLIQAREVYIETWTETVKPDNLPGRKETYTEYQTIPRNISWKGYLLLREFLTEEVGIILEAKEDGDLRDTDPF